MRTIILIIVFIAATTGNLSAGPPKAEIRGDNVFVSGKLVKKGTKSCSPGNLIVGKKHVAWSCGGWTESAPQVHIYSIRKGQVIKFTTPGVQASPICLKERSNSIIVQFEFPHGMPHYGIWNIVTGAEIVILGEDFDQTQCLDQ